MGPVRSWSMFKHERFNSWICRRVTNRANPEATVIKTYQVIEEKHTYHHSTINISPHVKVFVSRSLTGAIT